MAIRQGTPIWYELLSGDPDAAQDFYGRVTGRTFDRPPGATERDYRVAAAPDGEAVAGLTKVPRGARFYLMRGDGDRDGTAFAPMVPGHCSWNELVTSDQRAALGFYSALLGWEKAGSMVMGEMGEYTFLACGDTRFGAMMDAPEEGTAPYWNFAFGVPEIDAAKAAVEAGGGTVRQGPIELPENGGWLIQASDPEGATVMFTAADRAGEAS